MAVTHSNYAAFVKSEFNAIPCKVAQGGMDLTAVLKLRKSLISCGGDEFVWLGDLAGLCGNTGHEQTVERQLRTGEALRYSGETEETYPIFGEKPHSREIQGTSNYKGSGVLDFVVPNVGNVGTWLSSGSGLRYTVSDVSVRFLKAEYISDIISKGKWIPNTGALKNFYIITEFIQVTRLVIKLNKRAKAGAGVQLNLAEIPAGSVGVNYSQSSDGSLIISGVVEGGQPKPFPIAYRTAHVVYNSKDWILKRPMELGVRRGDDDGLYISEFVAKDKEFHIGEFFLKKVEEEDGDDDDEDEEEEEEELKLVPVVFEQLIPGAADSFSITCRNFKLS